MLQRTRLCGEQDQGVLASEFTQCSYQFMDAALLNTKPLGGFHQTLRYVRSFK